MISRATFRGVIVAGLLLAILAPAYAQTTAMRPDQFIAASWNWSGHQSVPPQALTDGATITPPSSFGFYTLTVGGSGHTIACPASVKPGDNMSFLITEGSGSNLINFNATCYKWFNQTPLSPANATVSGGDYVGCQFDTSTTAICGFGLTIGLPFTTPLQYADLAYWFDFSDATTTYSATTCSGGTISSGTIGSIKDKGSHGYCLAFGGGAATLSSGGFITTGTSTTWVLQTGTSGNPLALTNNIPYFEMINGIKYASATGSPGSVVSYSSTGTDASTTRAGCGLELGGAGVGIDVRARRLDADSGADASAGTNTGYTATLLAENCLINFAVGTLSVQANNGTVFSGSLSGSSNSSATNSLSVNTSDDVSPMASGSLVYQMIGRVPTSPPTMLSMQQGQTYVCSKMGVVC